MIATSCAFLLAIVVTVVGSSCPCQTFDDLVASDHLKVPSKGGNGYPAVVIDPIVCIQDAGATDLLSPATATKAALNGSNFDKQRIYGFEFRLVDTAVSAEARCDVLLQIVNETPQQLQKRELCPKQCSPLPTAQLPRDLLSPTMAAANREVTADGSISMQQLSAHRNFALTCSLTVNQILRTRHQQHRKRTPLWATPGIRGNEYAGVDPMYLLQQVAVRLLHECNEMVLIRESKPLARQQSKQQRRLMKAQKRQSNRDMQHSIARSSARVYHRRVLAVVVWIGSESTRPLIQQQSATLSAAAVGGTDAVVAWAATDRLYGCRDGTTGCRGGNARFNNLLPASNIRYMKPGWNCAQRRPLRALAHVLHLFDPTFLVLLDDDTFLNYELLMQRYRSLLFGAFKQQPHYFGEFQGKTGPQGHLTTGGIFAGGSGYILGRKLLQLLQRNEIHAFGHESWTTSATSPSSPSSSATAAVAAAAAAADEYRSAAQVLTLSVLAEGIAAAKTHCRSERMQRTGSRDVKWGAEARALQAAERSSSDVIGISSAAGAQRTSVWNDQSTEYNTCVLSMQSSDDGNLLSSGSGDNGSYSGRTASLNRKVPIAVRLIEVCANLMASENTCLHSDHSLGRCLMYAAHATPMGVACHSSVPLHTVPADVHIGMCFTAPSCNVSEQITCHRYAAVTAASAAAAASGLAVQRTRREGGYYKVFSSIFDGNMTDTFM